MLPTRNPSFGYLTHRGQWWSLVSTRREATAKKGCYLGSQVSQVTCKFSPFLRWLRQKRGERKNERAVSITTTHTHTPPHTFTHAAPSWEKEREWAWVCVPGILNWTKVCCLFCFVWNKWNWCGRLLTGQWQEIENYRELSKEISGKKQFHIFTKSD